MFAVGISVLMFVAILSLYSNLAMRIRLTKSEATRDKLVWWRRSSDDVAAAYEGLFPHSYLPTISQCAFWIVVILAAVVLVGILWKSL